jgi:hypothetical protein
MGTAASDSAMNVFTGISVDTIEDKMTHWRVSENVVTNDDSTIINLLA